MVQTTGTTSYTPWGFNGAYYYVRVGYGWNN